MPTIPHPPPPSADEWARYRAHQARRRVMRNWAAEKRAHERQSLRRRVDAMDIPPLSLWGALTNLLGL